MNSSATLSLNLLFHQILLASYSLKKERSHQYEASYTPMIFKMYEVEDGT